MFFKEYEEKQKKFCNFITRSFMNNKISHAYLIEINSVSYADDLIKEFVKFLLCSKKKCENNTCGECNVCHLVDIKSYPDLKIIDNGQKVIKKEQIIELQNLFSTKAIYGQYMVYIIKNVNNFTSASANTLLKFLEEPGENVIAILTTESISLVMDTIVSRCQILTFNKEENVLNDFYNKHKEQFIDEVKFNEKIKKYYNVFLNLEYEKTGFFLSDEVYSFKEELPMLFEFGVLFYSSLLNKNDLEFKDFDKKYFLNDSVSIIIEKLDLLNDLLEYAKINCNKDLLIDYFILKMCEVDK